MKQYVYRPYHSWRHEHRRERMRTWGIFALKLLLVMKMLVLTLRYLEANTFDYVYEKYVPEVIENSEKEEAFGIGFEPEEGSIFWFHQRTQEEKEVQ